MAKTKVFLKIAIVAFFGLSFFVPRPAYATLEQDQSSLSQEEISAAIEAGLIDTEVDESASVSAYSSGSEFFSMFSQADRYLVSAAQARSAYSRCSRAVVVGGEAWPDALTAAGLAGVWDCPIVLTEPDHLSQSARSVLSDLKVSQVTVLGGPDSVSDAALSDIRGMGIAAERIGGSDRYAVQNAAYSQLRDSWGTEYLFIASGAVFPDALTSSPAAFKTKSPIFLCDSNGNLTDYQKSLLSTAAKEGRYKRIVIAGGPNSVSTSTESFAKQLAGITGGDCTRLGGSDRYEVSANAAEWFVGQGILKWGDVAVAMGTKPYDALCGSVVQGKRSGALLILDNNDADTADAFGKLRQHKGAIKHLSVFGGKVSVSSGVRLDIADIFDIPYIQIPGFKVYIDAGHGWNNNNNGAYDPGAVGCGYQEATLTSELAGKISSLLRNQYGVDTYLNNDGGWYKLRHSEAIAQGCDLIISIHFNSLNGSAYGTESLIHSYNASKRSSGLQNVVHSYLVDGTGLRDRGKKTQEVAVIGGPLPAVLLEVGFIDNRGDMNTYAQRKDYVAQRIAAGIVAWAQ